ncbi:MAG: hypothetical protein JNIBNLAF_00698 [Nitrosomonas europaea]|nr:hypothetical protein [Nitrosomonas europaea]
MSARASVQLGMLQNIGCFVLRRAFKESLKNYLRCHFCVKNRLKMLIMYKLRFLLGASASPYGPALRLFATLCLRHRFLP